MKTKRTEILKAFDLHRRWLRTVVQARLGDDSLVDDVMQEIGLAILKRDDSDAIVGPIAPWLYRVAIRQVMMCRRSLGRHRKRCQEWTEARQAELDSSDTDPLRWVMFTEQRKQLRQAIANLPGQDREMLLLKYCEGWTYAQLAGHLGLPAATIQYRLNRARLRLRATLTKNQYTEVSL